MDQPTRRPAQPAQEDASYATDMLNDMYNFGSADPAPSQRGGSRANAAHFPADNASWPAFQPAKRS